MPLTPNPELTYLSPKQLLITDSVVNRIDSQIGQLGKQLFALSYVESMAKNHNPIHRFLNSPKILPKNEPYTFGAVYAYAMITEQLKSQSKKVVITEPEIDVHMQNLQEKYIDQFVPRLASENTSFVKAFSHQEYFKKSSTKSKFLAGIYDITMIFFNKIEAMRHPLRFKVNTW